MPICETGGPPRWTFRQLGAVAGLRHAVFTRRGGASRPPFDSLNVARSVGDDPAAVAHNRQLLQRAMGGGRTHYARQVHGRRVAVVDNQSGDRAPEADALVTARPGRLLVIQVADCQAVLLCDPRRRVAANVHAGWRGSVANVVAAAVETMRRRYGCRPADLLAGIGPSLGPCCAEFVNYRREIPTALWAFRRPGDRFDFWAVTRRQLRDCGLDGGNIETAGVCTRCSSDRYFSYRARKRTGRFAAVIGFSMPGKGGGG